VSVDDLAPSSSSTGGKTHLERNGTGRPLLTGSGNDSLDLIERDGCAVNKELEAAVLQVYRLHGAVSEAGAAGLLINDVAADKTCSLSQLLNVQHGREIRVELSDPLQGRELCQLGQKIGILDRVKRILVLQLGHEQFQEGVAIKLSRASTQGRGCRVIGRAGNSTYGHEKLPL
jgi:hypothetical protein